MNKIPFTKEQQLYQHLQIKDGGAIQLRDADDALEKDCLPGFPRIHLSEPEIGAVLKKELVTEHLNTLAPYLWLVSRQGSSRISSLTDQVVRGRSIIVTEKPELHLLWVHDRIFIKPLPKFLLSHAFWEHYLTSPSSPIPKPLRQDLRDAAVGLVRSYSYLITHESDYTIAQDERMQLVPKGIPYASFIEFVDCFMVSDDHVSSRFLFGEIYLARAKLLARFGLRDCELENAARDAGCTSGTSFAPAVFVVGAVLVLLATIQMARGVQVGIKELNSSDESTGGFLSFKTILLVLFMSSLVLSVVGLATRELIQVLKGLREKREILELTENPATPSSQAKKSGS